MDKDTDKIFDDVIAMAQKLRSELNKVDSAFVKNDLNRQIIEIFLDGCCTRCYDALNNENRTGLSFSLCQDCYNDEYHF